MLRLRYVVRHVVWSRYSLNVEQLLSIVLPSAIIYRDSHQIESWLQCVSPYNTQHFFMGAVTLLRIARSVLSRFFWEDWSRKHDFCFCFQSRNSLLNSLVFNFWNVAVLRRHLPNSSWLWLTFEMTKISFPANFFLNLG